MMKYLSLFSGIGGFELGIQNSNIEMECIGYSEIDKYAKSIYRRHFPSHRDLGDATKIQPEELPDFDLLVGGFPCQAFSYAGERRGLDDTRGTLFFEIARICKEKKPQYLLLENVPGLLSHDKGRTFSTFIRILTEMGYDILWEVHNSKNHGVPQNRERLFIKGYLRRGSGREVLRSRGDGSEDTGELKEVTSEENDRAPTAPSQREIITLIPGKQATRVMSIDGVSCALGALGGGMGAKTGLYAIPKPNIVGNFSPNRKHGGANVYADDGISPTLTATNYKHPITIRDDNRKIRKIGNHSKSGHHGKDVFDPDGLSPTLCAGSLYKNGIKICQPVLTPDRVNKRQNGRRMKENDDPMFTITAQDRHGVYDGYRFRRLTPKETERLQAFPDDWTKYGADDELISDTQRYKCTGNAVTTTVITYIINEMFGDMNDKA